MQEYLLGRDYRFTNSEVESQILEVRWKSRDSRTPSVCQLYGAFK